MLTRNRLTSNTLTEVDQGSFKNAVISVGKDYQAKLPSSVKVESQVYYQSLKRKYEIMLWSQQVTKVSDDEIAELITSARIDHNYTEEMCLGLIRWHKGKLDLVRKDLAHYVPKKEYWSTEERINFFMALDAHNKNFNVIKELFPNKTIGQLVSAYYLFKKNVSFLRDLNLPMFSSIPVGTSALRKVKKFDNIMPKHLISKFGGIIKSLPQPNNLGFNFNHQRCWSDHSFADPVQILIKQVEKQQLRGCNSRMSEQTRDLFLEQGRSVGRRKRSHNCINNHKRWLRDFYRLYNHQELLHHLQLPGDVKDSKIKAFDNEVRDGDTVIATIGMKVMQESKQLVGDFKKLQGQMPRFNPKWTEDDIQLAQLAIKQAGGDIKFVVSALGDKTINMVKHFISLYSQRLQIDEDIWQNLLSNSITKP